MAKMTSNVGILGLVGEHYLKFIKKFNGQKSEATSFSVMQFV